MIRRQYRNKRLGYFGITGDSSRFWENHWKDVNWRWMLDNGKSGALGHLEEPFLKYLPKEGKILEAGCGLGQLVVALRSRGYEVEGVDFSEETISMTREYMPDVPIAVGDVTKLDYPDEHFAAYISIGVMEHFEGGPEPALREANRVLAPNGHMLVSVPRIHAVRRLKIWMGRFSRPCEEGDFYQYAFSARDFARLLKRTGFRIQRMYYYDFIKGCKDEVPLFNYFYKRNQVPQRLLRAMDSQWLFRFLMAHMTLFVARKMSPGNQR